MPRKTKDAPGRVTPKGGRQSGAAGKSATSGRPASGRYTAPIPDEFRSSSRWVPVFIVAFFAAGVVVILLNYLGLLGHTSNLYLFIGLGLIVLGFISATRWR